MKKRFSVAPGAAALVVVAAITFGIGPANATLPGKNGLIAFAATLDHGGIATIGPDGSDEQLIPGTDGATNPAWSPDGTQIAFDRGGVWVMDADGSDAHQLVAGSTFHLSWSPDGTQIAYDTDVDGADQIAVVAADGTGAHQLSHCDDNCDSPAWSPDGTQIAYGANGATGHQLWIMNADGTHAREITHGPESNESDPSWSPDGTEIATVHDDFSTGIPSATSTIRVMNVDGSGAHDLLPPAEKTAMRTPVWSPDGTKIVYTRNDALFIMNADGSDPHALSTSSNRGTDPDWQRIVVTPPTTVVPAASSIPPSTTTPHLLSPQDGTQAPSATPIPAKPTFTG